MLSNYPATKCVLEDCAVLQFEFSDRNSNTCLEASSILTAASNVEVPWPSVLIGITFQSNMLYCTRLYAESFDVRAVGGQVAHDLRCKILHACLGCVDMFFVNRIAHRSWRLLRVGVLDYWKREHTKVGELRVYGDCVLLFV
jgi:hypothetical protein